MKNMKINYAEKLMENVTKGIENYSKSITKTDEASVFIYFDEVKMPEALILKAD